MQRLILALTLTGALLLVGVGAAHAQTPTLAVVPESAGQFQTITVTGAGFAPGAALWVTFISPDGEEIVYWPDTNRASVTADRNGRFSLSVVPAVDFAGAQAGRWRVVVCIFDGSECWERPFTVRA